MHASPEQIAAMERLCLERGGTVQRPGLPDEPPRVEPETWTEKAFQAEVIRLAKEGGWRVYHTYDSRRSDKGYPDLTMVRDIEPAKMSIIWAELKKEDGKPTKEQREWRRAIERAGGVCYLWRPSDLVEIRRVLS